MSRKRKNLLIFALICIIVGLSLVFLVSNNIDKENYIDSFARRNSGEVLMYSNSDSQQVSISMSPMVKQKINALSIRLKINYKGHDKPSLSDPQINSSLLENNWNFPIRQINYDDANKTIDVDISGAYLSTSAYDFVNPVNIATVKFNSSVNYRLSYQFDSTLTQVYSDKSVPLKLSFSY